MIDKFKKEFDIVYDYVISLGIGALQSFTPLFYQGVIVGSEFLTYNAMKLYLCHTISTVGSVTAGGFAACGTNFYNESNNVTYRMNFAQGFYNSGTPAVNNNPISTFEKNLYFSRISVGASMTEMKFIGYRLNFA